MASLESKVQRFVSISAAGSGNNTLLAAVANRKIRVTSLAIIVAGAVTVQWQSGAGGTALSGVMSLAANGGLVLPYNERGWFVTGVNTLLNMSLGGAVQVSGHFTYVLTP